MGSRTPRWPEERTKRLVAFLNEGMRPSVIARRMGLSYTSVYHQCIKHQKDAYEVKRVAEKAAKSDMRPCLKCKQDFKSSWIGNRICRGCSATNAGCASAFD